MSLYDRKQTDSVTECQLSTRWYENVCHTSTVKLLMKKHTE